MFMIVDWLEEPAQLLDVRFCNNGMPLSRFEAADSGSQRDATLPIDRTRSTGATRIVRLTLWRRENMRRLCYEHDTCLRPDIGCHSVILRGIRGVCL